MLRFLITLLLLAVPATAQRAKAPYIPSALAVNTCAHHAHGTPLVSPTVMLGTPVFVEDCYGCVWEVHLDVTDPVQNVDDWEGNGNPTGSKTWTTGETPDEDFLVTEVDFSDSSNGECVWDNQQEKCVKADTCTVIVEFKVFCPTGTKLRCFFGTFNPVIRSSAVIGGYAEFQETWNATQCGQTGFMEWDDFDYWDATEGEWVAIDPLEVKVSIYCDQCKVVPGE